MTSSSPLYADIPWLTITLDNNDVIGIFCDLQKAFDTVNYDIWLRKLDNYGIRGMLHAWFTDYLTGLKKTLHL